MCPSELKKSFFAMALKRNVSRQMCSKTSTEIISISRDQLIWRALSTIPRAKAEKGPKHYLLIVIIYMLELMYPLASNGLLNFSYPTFSGSMSIFIMMLWGIRKHACYNQTHGPNQLVTHTRVKEHDTLASLETVVCLGELRCCTKLGMIEGRHVLHHGFVWPPHGSLVSLHICTHAGILAVIIISTRATLPAT